MCFPSSGKASISSGLPLPLQFTWAFSPPKFFPVHFAIHVYPIGVTCKPFSGNTVAISAAQKLVATLQGQTLVTATLEAAGSLFTPLGTVTVVTPQALPSSWCLKGSGCSKHCPGCPCPHPPAEL